MDIPATTAQIEIPITDIVARMSTAWHEDVQTANAYIAANQSALDAERQKKHDATASFHTLDRVQGAFNILSGPRNETVFAAAVVDPKFRETCAQLYNAYWQIQPHSSAWEDSPAWKMGKLEKENNHSFFLKLFPDIEALDISVAIAPFDRLRGWIAKFNDNLPSNHLYGLRHRDAHKLGARERLREEAKHIFDALVSDRRTRKAMEQVEALVTSTSADLLEDRNKAETQTDFIQASAPALMACYRNPFTALAPVEALYKVAYLMMLGRTSVPAHEKDAGLYSGLALDALPTRFADGRLAPTFDMENTALKEDLQIIIRNKFGIDDLTVPDFAATTLVDHTESWKKDFIQRAQTTATKVLNNG